LPLRERAWLVDPGVEIPEGATEVHGITTERVRAEGLPTDAAIGEILTALDQALGTSRPLVIFNARYDLTVLDREARRQHYDVEEGGPVSSLALGCRRVVDPLVLDGGFTATGRGRAGSTRSSCITGSSGGCGRVSRLGMTRTTRRLMR
jgi:DNA polymerase-3 subunit epsilon